MATPEGVLLLQVKVDGPSGPGAPEAFPHEPLKRQNARGWYFDRLHATHRPALSRISCPTPL